MGTIEIGIEYYEQLVRDSEKLRVIEHVVDRGEYITEKTMRIILELPDKKQVETINIEKAGEQNED